jgi:hypothetical protein
VGLVLVSRCVHTCVPGVCVCVCLCFQGWILFLLNDTGYVRGTSLLWETLWALPFYMRLRLTFLVPLRLLLFSSEILGHRQLVCPDKVIRNAEHS